MSAYDTQIMDKVRACFADALGLDLEEVLPESRVIGDLGAESLDFLDIAFRLERAFDIRIPRGGVEAASKEGMADGETYEVNGVLTEAALKRLAEHMPEVPAAEFKAGLKVSEVATLFRVATFYNIVIKLQEEKKKSS